GDGDPRREFGPVAAHHRQLEAAADPEALARRQIARQLATVALAQRRGNDQLAEIPAQRLGAGVAEGLLGGRIELDDASLAVDRDDAVERRGDDRPLARSLARAA